MQLSKWFSLMTGFGWFRVGRTGFGWFRLVPLFSNYHKQDYINKCQDHLNNGPYTKIQKDPTESVKKEARQKLSLLKDAGKIDQQLYFKLKPTDSQTPRFYGLPKIHKPALPIRPIVSYTNSPLYQLSRYIADILRPYTKLTNSHQSQQKKSHQNISRQTNRSHSIHPAT